MPFTTIDNLPNNPFVRIFFVGLNILAPVDNTCQTFVHNEEDDHHLLIEVRRKRPGKPDVIAMRREGPLTILDEDESETHGFMILTQGLSPRVRGVRAYDGTRPSPEGSRLFDAFRLEHDILDVPPGRVGDVGLPSILIDHGTFYTADKQVRGAHFFKVGNGQEKRRGETPTIIGANIYRPATHVDLFWQEDEEDVHLTLEPSAHFTHEIYIINEPFFDPDSPNSPKHDEFARYFQMLPDVPREEQFTLTLDPFDDRGTTRNPCMSILLSE